MRLCGVRELSKLHWMQIEKEKETHRNLPILSENPKQWHQIQLVQIWLASSTTTIRWF